MRGAHRRGVALNPGPGESIGLSARRNADGTFAATDCDRSAPENLRAAAATPDSDCTEPRVKAIKALGAGRASKAARFRVRLAGAQGRVDRLRVDWGDGSARTYRFDPEDAGRTVTIAHRFRRTGLRRVRVRASAEPVLACAVFGMPPRAASPERTRVVRVRRG